MQRKIPSLAVSTALSLALAAPAALLAQADQPGQTPQQQDRQQATQQSRQSALYDMKVEDIKGKNVVNLQGEELGSVDEVVISRQDRSAHVVITMGGLFGIGGQQVAVPLEQMQPQDDRLMLTSAATEDELKNRPAYQERDYQQLEDEVQISQAAGSGPQAGDQQQASLQFQQLDQDGDGYISAQEAQSHPQLSQQWNELDQNRDQRLDQSEFAAFEPQRTQQQQQQQQQQPGQPGMGQGMGPGMGQQGMSPQFQRLDQDGDGYISQQEAEQHPRLSQQWTELDRNNDGRLDQDEFAAFETPGRQGQPGMGPGMGQGMGSGMGGPGMGQGMGQQGMSPQFQRLDQDGDGYISQQEAEQHPRLLQQWTELDRNNDGRLDQDEFAAFETPGQQQRQPQQPGGGSPPGQPPSGQ